MSAIDEAIAKAIDQTPVIEFAHGCDWVQIAPFGDQRYRWRHHRAAGWAMWEKCTRARLAELNESADQSTVRLIPRAEADDWRSRPGFPCHKDSQ